MSLSALSGKNIIQAAGQKYILLKPVVEGHDTKLFSFIFLQGDDAEVGELEEANKSRTQSSMSSHVSGGDNTSTSSVAEEADPVESWTKVLVVGPPLCGKLCCLTVFQYPFHTKDLIQSQCTYLANLCALFARKT